MQPLRPPPPLNARLYDTEAGDGGKDCAGFRPQDGRVLALAREGPVLLPIARAIGA